MYFSRTKFRNRQCRDGISIIEVLTSMAVAAIGVFGVMIMIPFAVKQSQTGLDNDAANSLGRNATEELQVNGLLQVDDDGNFTRLVVNAIGDVGSGITDSYNQSCGSTNFGNERAP
jgi:Tfp pilus assembly protein PilV